METVIGSFPIKDPHSKKRQESWIVNLGPVHLSEPFSPSDHVGPKTIIEEEVRVCVPPPLVMSSNLVFSCLPNPMEGVLGDLSISLSVSYKQERRGKLPQTSKGNDHNPMTGYAPDCPNTEYHQEANLWLAG